MNKHFILTLMKSPKVSRRTVKKIIDTMEYSPSGLQDLHDLLKKTKQYDNRINLPTLEQLKQADSTAKSISLRASDLGIKIMGFTDSTFPQRLKDISDPPVILYAKGNTDCLNAEYSVAVIGTRKPTKYGKDMAECFGMVFGEKGLIVISGLAIGCDTAAHQGCLNVSGKTVAVLANGLDTIYPKQNTELAEQILKNSGCIVSEYPPGEKIMSNFFVERDRLQSALSKAVVVVETDVKGGTMHTVKFSIDQNKILACLSHPEKLETSKSNGNKKLITEGKALPIKNLNDIEELINRVVSTIKIDKPHIIKNSSVNMDKQLILPLGQEEKEMG